VREPSTSGYTARSIRPASPAGATSSPSSGQAETLELERDGGEPLGGLAKPVVSRRLGAD